MTYVVFGGDQWAAATESLAEVCSESEVYFLNARPLARHHDEWKQRHDDLLHRLLSYEYESSRTHSRLSREIQALQAELLAVKGQGSASLVQTLFGSLIAEVDKGSDKPVLTEGDSDLLGALD